MKIWWVGVCVCVYEREIVTFALLLITTEYCHWCL